MSFIIYTSAIEAPGTLQPPVPRYEIGKFFVNIYHSVRRVKANDEECVKRAAKKLVGCLGKERPMFVNQYHPSSPPSNTVGSIYAGTKEEVHDDTPRLAHYHVELIGTQRDDGFTEEEIEVLKNKLDNFDWT
jgi:hypothetical protein